jgi:hypothetical protein
MKGSVFRVEKLKFVPVSLVNHFEPDKDDLEYIQMIEKI